MKNLGLILVLITLVFMLTACQSADYGKANENTRSMTDYTMLISTIVTVEDGEDVKQSAIEQNVRVNDKGKKSMIYSVETTATSTDVSTTTVTSEENSYMFYENSYYYTYPGVRYKSGTEYSMALANIENLTDVITFSEEEMLNTVNEKSENGEVFYYQVNYEDVSLFVKSLLENAATAFDNVKFSPVDISASVTVVKNSVAARELYVEYASKADERITVEIYTQYLDAEKVEKPDESKYVNIAG